MPSKQTMDDLAAAAAELNQASNQLNELIESFEDQLHRAGVGVTAWLGDGASWKRDYLLEAMPLGRDADHDDAVQIGGWLLGYAKFENRWRVMVKRVQLHMGDEQDEGQVVIEDGSAMPLLKAPRSVRVESATMLEELAQHLTKRMKAHARDIAMAKQSFDKEGAADQTATANELPRRAWDDKWLTCVQTDSPNVTPRPFAGAPVEYARQHKWRVVASVGELVLVDDSKQLVVIGPKPNAQGVLALVGYEPGGGLQRDKEAALQILKSCWTGSGFTPNAYKERREFVVTLDVLATAGIVKEFTVGQAQSLSHEARSLLSYQHAIRELAEKCPPSQPLPI